VSGTTNRWLYVYDGWAIIAVLHGTNGTLAESFTRGVGLAGDVGTLVAVRYYTGSATGQTHYLHANHRGDVIESRYGTQSKASYDYRPFGQSWSASATQPVRFRFSSKEYESELLMYNFGARFYMAEWERWPNRDPIEEEGGINLYCFCFNNPVNIVDPLGLSFWSATRNFAFGVVGGAVATFAVGTVTVVATVAASPVIAVAAGVTAVGAVAYGGYQLGKGLFEVGTGEEAYTGRTMSGEERIDQCSMIAGGLVGGGLVGKGFVRGREITRGKGFRLAPFGNRTGHPHGELPHYHRSVPNPRKPGQSMPGQSVKRHRPWDESPVDQSFWDRF
jgi:RHS repeat-associated protein